MRDKLQPKLEATPQLAARVNSLKMRFQSDPHFKESRVEKLAEYLEDDEKDAKGGKSSSEGLEQKLLESRTILVEGPVTDKMFRNVSARLLFLEHKGPGKEILVIVNSPGGSADSGFGIFDVMRFIDCPVTTLCAGLCASAAVLIYLGGRKGRRFTLPNSRFLLHQPSTQAYGQASDMEITAKEIIRTRERYADIVATEIGNTDAKRVMESSNRDFWLNAPESVKYGLASKIVLNRKELKDA